MQQFQAFCQINSTVSHGLEQWCHALWDQSRMPLKVEEKKRFDTARLVRGLLGLVGFVKENDDEKKDEEIHWRDDEKKDVEIQCDLAEHSGREIEEGGGEGRGARESSTWPAR